MDEKERKKFEKGLKKWPKAQSRLLKIIISITLISLTIGFGVELNFVKIEFSFPKNSYTITDNSNSVADIIVKNPINSNTTILYQKNNQIINGDLLN